MSSNSNFSSEILPQFILKLILDPQKCRGTWNVLLTNPRAPPAYGTKDNKTITDNEPIAGEFNSYFCNLERNLISDLKF